jgi:hypothetical protein
VSRGTLRFLAVVAVLSGCSTGQPKSPALQQLYGGSIQLTTYEEKCFEGHPDLDRIVRSAPDAMSLHDEVFSRGSGEVGVLLECVTDRLETSLKQSGLQNGRSAGSAECRAKLVVLQLKELAQSGEATRDLPSSAGFEVFSETLKNRCD